MRSMYHRAAMLAALIMASAAAFATPTEPNPCGNHGNNCNPQTPSDPGNEQNQTNDQTQAQGQGQAQGQLQGQGQQQSATGGQGGRGGDGGHAVAAGGRGGAGGSAGAAAESASSSGALSGSASGVSGSGNSGSESASSSGGNTLAGGDNTASNDGSGNSSTNLNVDASTRSSYTAQSLWIPDIQTAAPALVASPTLTIERGVCGPRHEKRSTSVDGTYVGLFKRSRLDLGVEDEVTPAAEPYRYWKDPQGVTHVFGHQLITAFSVNGVAASRAVGLGGGKTGGDWGQAGVSSGSSVQRTIIRVQIVECELPVQQAAPQETYIEPTVNG